jgi:KUP system potassium uptake protein
MVVLATLATVIASQALISGAFTLTEQAIALNLSPRMRVIHTSQDERGQVYLPFVNTLVAIVCLILVFTFRSSARLAAMYGLAVACTMLATSLAFYVVATTVFKWPKRFVIPGMAPFVLIDALFVTSGLPKFLDGAWVPIAVSAIIAFISLTWLKGRRALASVLAADQQPLAEFIAHYPRPASPTGQAVMLTNDPRGIPFVRSHPVLSTFLDDAKIVLLTLDPASRPYVEQAKRATIEQIEPTVFVIRASFGYMEEPSIKYIVSACNKLDFKLDDERTIFFFSVPAIVGRAKNGMHQSQRALFAWLSRVSRSLVDDLEIPPNRRVGIGVEVEI